MNEKQWKIFCGFREEFFAKTQEWEKRIPQLKDYQEQAAMEAKTPSYSFETPVVYNRTLDEITMEDDIKLIVIGDNPGKDEQLEKNRKYLVGQAGKIAEGFFRRNPVLGIDFRKNAVILNKTPVHSAKTVQLKRIMALGGEPVSTLITESQLWMARETAKLHRNLCEAADNQESQPELWLVGYAELKNRGFFTGYRDELKNYYGEATAWNKVYVFQHFSMNRFSIDLKEYMEKDEENLSLEEAIHQLGNLHKQEIFK